MNQYDVQLVQNSFELVKPIAETAADLFYGRLFELDPTLRPLFKDNLTEQKHNLMTTLAFVVAGLNKPASLKTAVQQLGKRHVGYGVQPHHYQTVGAALLWTLGQGLADQFTPEVETAWTSAYAFLAETMQSANVVAKSLP